jgi:hypothetical protein
VFSVRVYGLDQRSCKGSGGLGLGFSVRVYTSVVAKGLGVLGFRV